MFAVQYLAGAVAVTNDAVARCRPQHAVTGLVETEKILELGVFRHRQGFESSFVQARGACSGTNQQMSFAIFKQREDVFTGQPLCATEALDLVALDAIEATCGPDPQCTVAGAQDRPDLVAGESAARIEIVAERRSVETRNSGVVGADPDRVISVLKQGHHVVSGRVAPGPVVGEAATVQSVESVAGANPQMAVTCCANSAHVIFAQAAIGAVGTEGCVLQSDQPCAGADPQAAFAIFGQCDHTLVRQALFDAEHFDMTIAITDQPATQGSDPQCAHVVFDGQADCLAVERSARCFALQLAIDQPQQPGVRANKRSSA